MVEYIQSCENCSKKLYSGDVGFWSSDNCVFCSNCSPKLSDKVAQHKEVIGDEDEDTMLEMGYVDFAEMRAFLRNFEADLLNGDPSLATRL